MSAWGIFGVLIALSIIVCTLYVMLMRNRHKIRQALLGRYHSGGVIRCTCGQIDGHDESCPLRPYRVGERMVPFPPRFNYESNPGGDDIPYVYGAPYGLTQDGLTEVTSDPFGGTHYWNEKGELRFRWNDGRDEPRGIALWGDALWGDALWGDEGEPLTNPPPPNIGGEDHPEYKGPHYGPDETTPEQRYIPYDMLRDPIPGTGAHRVKEEGEDE